MKILFNVVGALGVAAITSLVACSDKSAKTDASDDKVAPNYNVVEAVEEGTNDAVIEIAAGTNSLDAYKDKLTMVDFNAEWCGPCRQYGPTFHAVAKEMASKANFLSVNIDSCPAIAEKYVGQYIPQTTAILPDGRTFNKIGQLSGDDLRAFVDSVAAL